MRILKFFALFIFLTAVVWFFIGPKKTYHIVTGKIFGTYYTVKIRNSDENKLLQKSINDELSKINARMSVFDLTSEISEINKAEANQWIELSEDMQFLLKNSYKIYQMSNGAFDPTTGKLIDLWGFGTTGKIKKIPNEEDIANMLKTTGFDKIQFNKDYSQLKKQDKDIMINLSAIAKGYGVDRLAKLLKSLGYTDFIIEVGGEVVASGNKSKEIKGWNVGVVKPSETTNENAFIVTLKDYAVATSGDYRNFFYIGEEKYSHTIDPKTGYPAKNNLLSVTVFHESCMIADGLATAIMSMGEEKGLNFANNNKLAVIMFVKTEDNQIKNIVSQKAQKLIGQ
ncbi:MAG: FAD:protein FMN transferase [Alphaproteobacteria bacterium]|nr:FAD:protein FMN transferase [Alphaproteobacteria bacterium]